MFLRKCLFLILRFLLIASFKFRTKDDGGSRNEVGSLNLTKRLVVFEPVTLQFTCTALTHWATQVRVFKKIWFVVVSFWDFLAYLSHLQMKPQLLIVIDIFKLNSSRHKSAMRVWMMGLFFKFTTGANQ